MPPPSFCCPASAANDGRPLAQRLRGRCLCHPSAARRIGGMGGGAEGRFERPILCVDPVGIFLVRSPSALVGSLPHGDCPVCFGTDGQAHAGNAPLRLAAAGLLAAWADVCSGVGQSSCLAGKIRSDSGRQECLPHLVIEKIPLLVLSACSCVVTSIVQSEVVARLERLPLPSRLDNAVVSYVAYLGKFVWPTSLSVFYPHPGAGLTEWQVVAALLVLGGITVAAVAFRRRIPCLLVGWLWYLGMLVPVIGLIQVGGHAMADRYTYLPQIGLCIALAWTVAHLTASWPNRVWILGVAAGLAVVLLMGCAWRQATFCATLRPCGSTRWSAIRTTSSPTTTSPGTWQHTARLTRRSSISR